MFFIVLDLRLTKVGVQRNSFFYAHFRVVFPFVFVRKKTPLRSIQNALAFELKRPCVFLKAAGASSGVDEVFSVRHNSSVPTRAHVRARTNYIM